MNPRKLVMAAVALVAMVTVAKYTGCLTPKAEPAQFQPSKTVTLTWDEAIHEAEIAAQKSSDLARPIESGNDPVSPIFGLTPLQSPAEILNKMSAEQKTAFDNWLRQIKLKPETMTPQQKASYILMWPGR